MTPQNPARAGSSPMIILTPQDPSDFQYSMAVTQDREARLDRAVRDWGDRSPYGRVYRLARIHNKQNLTPLELIQIRKEFARG